jgi:Family of unknown function (DUF6011)
VYTQDFRAERASLLNKLSHMGPSLEDFRHALAESFGQQTDGKVYKRQPSMTGLRLPLAGDPQALLVAKPVWDRREKNLSAYAISVEILEADDANDDLWRVNRHRPTAIRLELTPDNSRPTCWSRQSDAALDRLAEVIGQLQSDPAACVAGNIYCDHCRMCGKVLTDGHSMLRGYGPDCAKKAAYLIEIFARARVEK